MLNELQAVTWRKKRERGELGLFTLMVSHIDIGNCKPHKYR